MTKRVEVAAVTKSYGGSAVLKGIDLTIEAGEFAVLLGPSGSGKSTLLRLVGGLEKIDSGEIRFDGKVIASSKTHTPPDRRDLSMVFQDFALWPHMNALENVSFALERYEKDAKVRRRLSAEMLERVGLSSKADRFPSNLSGGEQQRLSLARALVARPSLILFDEPLSSLDADLKERLRIEISELTREVGSGALYITHDQSEAFALADRVALLNDGQLIQVDAPEVIYRNPATPFVAHFTGVAGEMDGEIVGWRDDQSVMVATKAGTILAKGCGGLEKRSKQVRLMLRGSAARINKSTSGADGVVSGRVVDVAFRGRGYDHVIELIGGTRLVGIFAHDRWDRDDQVQITLSADQTLAFPIDKDIIDLDSLAVDGAVA
ncbi:MAG: ABC transporter ATP-binding protein [Actinomycetota bacterium]|nr:ABC transporter ATP-binding protein [Actinomycetota bacterium]